MQDVAFSPDGHYLAVGRRRITPEPIFTAHGSTAYRGNRDNVYVFDLDTVSPKPVATWSNGESITAIAFGPDGLVATGSERGMKIFSVRRPGSWRWP